MCDIDGVDVIDKGYEVGIAHADIGAFEDSAIGFEYRRTSELLWIFQSRLQHIHCHRIYNLLIILKMQFQYLDAR